MKAEKVFGNSFKRGISPKDALEIGYLRKWRIGINALKSEDDISHVSIHQGKFIELHVTPGHGFSLNYMMEKHGLDKFVDISSFPIYLSEYGINIYSDIEEKSLRLKGWKDSDFGLVNQQYRTGMLILPEYQGKLI